MTISPVFAEPISHFWENEVFCEEKNLPSWRKNSPSERGSKVQVCEEKNGGGGIESKKKQHKCSDVTGAIVTSSFRQFANHSDQGAVFIFQPLVVGSKLVHRR